MSAGVAFEATFWVEGEIAGMDGGHLLPGFRYPIADLFKEWHWE